MRNPEDMEEAAMWSSAPYCSACGGEGTVTVGGTSVNPFTGVLVSDPQEAHDEVCPDCGGTGNAEPELEDMPARKGSVT